MAPANGYRPHRNQHVDAPAPLAKRIEYLRVPDVKRSISPVHVLTDKLNEVTEAVNEIYKVMPKKGGASDGE